MERSIYIPRQVIDDTLESIPTDGKKSLEPLKSLAKERNLPINILENTNKANPPEIHLHEDDLWISISGKITFVVGGTIVGGKEKVRSDGSVDKNEIVGDRIDGGETYTLTQGDILYIPAGEPHMHSADGTARLYIIKLPKN